MHMRKDETLCKCEDEFTVEQWRQVDAIIESYSSKPGALIPVLEEIQDVTGYLPEVIQKRVSKGLGVALSQVYGVVTFYSYFTMKPRGKHEIKVCLGTACHVRGGQKLLEKLEDKLRIKPGDCTDDRLFSLDLVRCIGACGVAPVMVVGRDVHKQVKPVRLNAILSIYDR